MVGDCVHRPRGDDQQHDVSVSHHFAPTLSVWELNEYLDLNLYVSLRLLTFTTVDTKRDRNEGHQSQEKARSSTAAIRSHSS